MQVAEGGYGRFAQMLDPDGDPVTTQGAPTLGVSWDPDSGLSGVVLKDGRAPTGLDEVAIDKATADRVGYEVGDTIRVVLRDGQESFTIVGLVGLGNSDGFVGATTVVWDHRVGGELARHRGHGRHHRHQGRGRCRHRDGRSARSTEILPERTEVVTGEQLADETKDQVGEIVSIFGTGLLIFALITALVAAFVINNIYNISISQRLRELALMRAVGASARQVRRLVLMESVVISVIATLDRHGRRSGRRQGPDRCVQRRRRWLPADTAAVQAAHRGRRCCRRDRRLDRVGAAPRDPRRHGFLRSPRCSPEIGFSALGLSRRLIRGVVRRRVGSGVFGFGLFVRPGTGPPVGS